MGGALGAKRTYSEPFTSVRPVRVAVSETNDLGPIWTVRVAAPQMVLHTDTMPLTF